MLVYRNAEGVNGHRKFDTPVLNLNPIPSPRGALVGLVLQQKLQATQIETRNTINQWSVVNFKNVKPPRTNAMPPY